MPLTPAERAKRYREKLKLDKERYNEKKRKELARIKMYTKRIGEVNEAEKQKMRATWRQYKKNKKLRDEREKKKKQKDKTGAERARRYREKLKNKRQNNEIVFIELDDDANADILQNLAQDGAANIDSENLIEYDYAIDNSKNLKEDDFSIDESQILKQDDITIENTQIEDGITFCDPQDLFQENTCINSQNSIINVITDTNKKIIFGLKNQVHLQNTIEKYKRNEQRLNLQIKSLELQKKENKKLQEDNDKMHDAIQEFLGKIVKRE